MQTRQMLYALGLATLGLAPLPGAVRPAVAAPEARTNQVTDVAITSEAGLTRIVITGTQPFTPEVRNLRRPSATIVTVPGQWKAGRSGTRRIGRNGVSFIRCGQFSRAPHSTVRLVANNRRRLDFEALPSPDRTRWEVILKEPGVIFVSQVASPTQGAIPVVAPALATPMAASRGIAPVIVPVPAHTSSPRSIVPSGTPAATANPVASIASVGAIAVTTSLPITTLPGERIAPLLASAIRMPATTAARHAAPSLLSAAGLFPQPRIPSPTPRLRPRRTSRASIAPHSLLAMEPSWRTPDEPAEAPAAIAVAAAPTAPIAALVTAQPAAPEPMSAPTEPAILAEGPPVVPDASLLSLASTRAPEAALTAAAPSAPLRDTLPALPSLAAPAVVQAPQGATSALTLQASKPAAPPAKPAAEKTPPAAKPTRPAAPPAAPTRSAEKASPPKENPPAPEPPRPIAPTVATAPSGLRVLPMAPAGSAADENAPDVTKRLVSLDFNSTEITDILKAIAVQSGVNIISGDDVKDKKITLTLRKVMLIDALDWVAKLSGFRYALINNTFVVGTGANLAGLTRRPSVSEAVSASVPFFYSDATTLVGSVMAAFPNANVTAVGVSAESKLVDSGVQNNQSTTNQSGNTSSSGTTSSTSTATIKLTPRGGVLNVVGTLDEVERIKQFVEETERSLVLSAQREAEYNAKRMANFVTETYAIKYSAVADLIALLHRMVPTVDAYPGPTPNFVATPSGTSASYGSSGSSGPGAAAAAGGSSGSGAQGAIAPTTLILTGPPADVTRALATLDKLDLKQPQLLFEAKLVEVNTSDLKQLGVNYDITRGITVGEKNFGEGAIGPENGSSTGRKPEMGAIYRTPYSVGMGIQALVQNNRAKILASPNMMALNNNPATTFIGDQLKYVINVQQTPVGPAIQTETASVGITLKAVGRAKPDNTIELYVHPEVSVISRFVSVAGTAISLPQIATRFTDSTVRVKDGETIAIGGLLREQDIANLQKLPVLGDLPVLGQLFRSTDKRKERTELMIFITCRVAKD